MRTNAKLFKSIRVLVMSLAALIFFSPFYISIVYSFKSPEESAQSPLSFPTKFHFENYTKAIEVSNFFHAFKNSLIVTVSAVIILVIVCSMAGYIISRKNNKFYNIFYYLFLASIVLPFQVVMLPLYKLMKDMGLLNTLPGLILAVTGFQVGFNIFLYTGFMKTIPREMEEAAMIDGCSKFKTFWLIIFPMLKPINATIVVLSALSAWNEFPVSLIIAQKQDVRTLPLTQYFFVGQYSIDINMAFAAFTLSMIPILILYFFLQKHITKGVTAGAVKG